eukprot:362203-Chlamydomonas_euryale.AAC.12
MVVWSQGAASAQSFADLARKADAKAADALMEAAGDAQQAHKDAGALRQQLAAVSTERDAVARERDALLAEVREGGRWGETPTRRCRLACKAFYCVAKVLPRPSAQRL